MKILLLANQPESTTRLKLFRTTLLELGYKVVVPEFDTRNWLSIARLSQNLIIKERPDVVHIFNVPDIIYRKIPQLKGKYFQKLIYDYRSPWGVELEMIFGLPVRWIGEYYEKTLAVNADAISTVNSPLMEKVKGYIENQSTPIELIPNYPLKEFNKKYVDLGIEIPPDTVLFVGRVSKQEGIPIVMDAAKRLPHLHFFVIGDGPFSWYFLRRKSANLVHFGWQSHNKIPFFIKHATLCIKPTFETPLTKFATDKSVWKLNEYLNMGKRVIASGIQLEEERKNLILTQSSDFINAIEDNILKTPQRLSETDFRFWEDNTHIIGRLYSNIV